MINGPHDFITPVELLIVYFSPAQLETFERVATWAEHKNIQWHLHVEHITRYSLITTKGFIRKWGCKVYGPSRMVSAKEELFNHLILPRPTKKVISF